MIITKKRIILITFSVAYLIFFAFVVFQYARTPRFIAFHAQSTLTKTVGETAFIVVDITNRTLEPLTSNDNFFLSYHLFSTEGYMLQHDNVRSRIEYIPPGRRGPAILTVGPIDSPGQYILEVDVLKEGAFWFGYRMNPRHRINLLVEE